MTVKFKILKVKSNDLNDILYYCGVIAQEVLKLGVIAQELLNNNN